MIAILGSTHDDILYFESVMANKQELMIMNKFPAIKGYIFNQETILVYNIYSSYVSAAVTANIIDNYFVLLVFNVGKSIAFTDDLHNGDIVVSKRTYLGDVDQCDVANVRTGQIPGFEYSFESQADVLESVDKSLEIRTLVPNKKAHFIATNKEFTNIDQLNDIRIDKSIFGETRNIALDSTVGGVAVTCAIHNIPFVAVKVIYKQIGEKSTANGYANVLKSFTGVGKSIVTCIGDIGRNEVVRGEE